MNGVLEKDVDEQRELHRRWSMRLTVVVLIGLSAGMLGYIVYQEFGPTLRRYQPPISRNIAPPIPETQPAKPKPIVKDSALLEGTWQQLHQRGIEAMQEGRLSEASLAFRSAMASVARGLDTRAHGQLDGDIRYATSSYYLANVYRLLGNFNESEKLFLETRNPEIGNKPEYMLTQEWLALLQLERNVPASYATVINLRPDGNPKLKESPAEQLRLLALLAESVAFRDEKPHFHKYYYQVLDRLPTATISEGDLGFIYYHLGRGQLLLNCPEEAATLLSRSIPYLEGTLPPDHPDIILAKYNLGVSCLRQHKLEQAKRELGQARSALERMEPNDLRMAKVLRAQAALARYEGDSNLAASLLERNISICRKNPAFYPWINDPDVELTQALIDLALIQQEQGNLGQVAETMGEAWRLFRSAIGVSDRIDIDNMHWRELANAYLSLGEFEKAGEVIQVVLRHEESWRQPSRAALLDQLAAIYRSSREFQKAAECEAQIKAIREKPANRVGDDPANRLYWESWHNLLQGDYDAALDCMRQRLALRRQRLCALLPALSEQAASMSIRGELLAEHYMLSLILRCKDHEKAAQAAIEVEMACKSIITDAQAQQQEALLTQKDESLSKLLAEIAAVRSAIANQNLATTCPASGPAVESVNSALAITRPGDTIPATKPTGPNGQAMPRYSFSYSPDGKLARITLVEGDKMVSNYALNPLEADMGLPSTPLENRLAELERSLGERCAPVASLKKTSLATWQALSNALPDNTAFVSYISVADLLCRDKKDRYLAVVVRKGRPPVLIDLGEDSEIDEVAAYPGRMINYFLSNAGTDPEASSESEFREGMSIMSRVLIRPLWDYIKDNPKWIISPDGALSTLPFALMQLPGGQGYVGEKYDISYVNSARDILKFGQPPTASSRGMILGNPDFSATPSPCELAMRAGEGDLRHLQGLTWESLPGTEVEARCIAEQLQKAGVPVDLELGQKATKSALLEAQRPRFLHVATHGFFLSDGSMQFDTKPFRRSIRFENGHMILPSNPLMYSGIALAGANGQDGIRDGIATAYEMKGMNLQGTELVTLSACETGLGTATSGGGVRGLRQALLQSGARRLVTSLWKVPDEETTELMEAFYARLLKGEPASSALRQAMLEVRSHRQDKRGAAHPFFWGAFVLIGDPGPISLK